MYGRSVGGTVQIFAWSGSGPDSFVLHVYRDTVSKKRRTFRLVCSKRSVRKSEAQYQQIGSCSVLFFKTFRWEHRRHHTKRNLGFHVVFWTFLSEARYQKNASRVSSRPPKWTWEASAEHAKVGSGTKPSFEAVARFQGVPPKAQKVWNVSIFDPKTDMFEIKKAGIPSCFLNIFGKKTNDTVQKHRSNTIFFGWTRRAFRFVFYNFGQENRRHSTKKKQHSVLYFKHIWGENWRHNTQK